MSAPVRVRLSCHVCGGAYVAEIPRERAPEIGDAIDEVSDRAHAPECRNRQATRVDFLPDEGTS